MHHFLLSSPYLQKKLSFREWQNSFSPICSLFTHTETYIPLGVSAPFPSIFHGCCKKCIFKYTHKFIFLYTQTYTDTHSFAICPLHLMYNWHTSRLGNLIVFIFLLNLFSILKGFPIPLYPQSSALRPRESSPNNSQTIRAKNAAAWAL